MGLLEGFAVATVSKKRLIGYDACGTDGSDQAKMKAIYQVLDSDGFSFERVRIAKSISDAGVGATIDAELKKEAGIP